MQHRNRPDRSRPGRVRTRSRNHPRPRPQRAGRAARILIIEDEPEERLALQLLLETDRREVRAAADGDEAMAILDQFRPDLVVMDWRMPGLSGAGLCRYISARVNPPPIVVVSSAKEAFESTEDIAVALHKPVDPGELQSVVGTWLPSQPR